MGPSSTSESVSTILVTSKQTRFHIETPNYKELDIEDVCITVTSGEANKPAGKLKGKAKAEGTEILNNAKLRLVKAGQRYALVGRNGSGKSTLLRAIADKLIPGIPEESRITILQQTYAFDVDNAADSNLGKPTEERRPVLEEVIEKVTAKNDLEQEIRTLSNGINSTDTLGPLRALRQIKHERLQKQFFLLDKDARLRSGARGWKARKDLTAFERTIAEVTALYEQHEDEITADVVQAETQEAIDMLADLQLQIEPSRIADIKSKAHKILLGLGFSDAIMNTLVSNLSGGWKMRTALATSLLQETDILILDEPTNFLDLLGIIWLQRFLESLEDTPDPPTLIIVSHDRDFISICTDLLILKDKAMTYFHGDLPTYEASQSERKLYLTKMKEAQDKQKAHIQKTIAQNIKQGKANDDDNKLRQAKSRQKKLDDRWGLQVNSKGGRFKLNRDLAGFHITSRAELDVPVDERPINIVLPAPPDLRFPGALISLENVSFRYPVKSKSGTSASVASAVLQDVDLTVHMGDRIGILGLNGAGKSTLIKLVVGEEKPTKGTIDKHPRLRLGYYSQSAVDALLAVAKADVNLTALALLTQEIQGELDEGALRSLLGSLGLPGRIASDIPVQKLSGGQVVRCELARILWRRPQCLILDEVTTHLDYETVAALREALRDWAGAVVLVSHDRWFMRGAVEGLIDEEDSESDSGRGEGEGESMRRRVVYRLKEGKLVLLDHGVSQFEEIMQKRAMKLMDS